MPDQYGLPKGPEAFVKPIGLTKLGARAYDHVMKIATKALGKQMDAGGCKTFYSPAKWKATGHGGYAKTLELVVLFEGGDLHDIFSYYYDSEAREELGAALAHHGLWFEDLTNYSLGIYRMYPDSSYDKNGEPNTNSRVDRAERRLDLRCSFCPPNRKENAKRKERGDKYKDRRK